ncbi:protein of unknown function [Yoonia litorea]|uniref:DUF3859 domain-containing protein n=2 Tax=Yoonia litorea TaxID=1123755 RepID=A0A1I6MXL8_9RHOB|nr:protein of unknown function [Yoonia litorea]
MIRIGLVIFLSLATVLPAAAQIARAAKVDWLEAGVICAPEAIGFRDAPETITGRAHIIEAMPDFVAQTQVVPAVIGVGFGVKLQATAETPFQPVTITLSHPPMGAEGISRQSFTSAISGETPTVAFFQFDHGYELVEGTWYFEAREGDQLIYRVAFRIVPPQQVPALANACHYQDLLS